MIEFKDVAFQYEQGSSKGKIENINLTIHDGEVVLICGESGCGKTTLTRLINGLIPHYYEGTLTGQTIVEGIDVKNVSLYALSGVVGSVFQNPRTQFFTVDTTSEIAFGCENLAIDADEINLRIEKTVGALKIEDLLNRSLFALSGGEKQKIACASVSAMEPDIFVLDEPSSNLDIKSIRELKDVLRKWKAQGKTIVIAEHRLYYLMDIADRVLYMQDGQIKENLSISDCSGIDTLFNQFQNPIHFCIWYNRHHIHFWQGVHHNFAASVIGNPAVLVAAAADLIEGCPLNACLQQRFFQWF